MSEAIATAAAYDLIDRFLRNNLYDDDYAKYSDALEALSQPAPSPQLAVPVVSGWSIDDHRDGSVTVKTPDGAACKLFKHGGGGVENIAYRLSILAMRPQDVPMTPDEKFVRELLWEAHPECCGNPCVGAQCMDQTEMVCCGCPNMDTLNDKQIVSSLRARYPEISGITAKAEGGAKP